jgi:hypothetical protein
VPICLRFYLTFTTINTDNINETMECIDYNECEQGTNPCGSHGECINLEGEFTDYLVDCFPFKYLPTLGDSGFFRLQGIKVL